MKLWILQALFLATSFAGGELCGQTVSSPKPPVGVPADAVTVNGKWYKVYLEKLTWLVPGKSAVA